MYLTYAKTKSGEMVHVSQHSPEPLYCPYCNLDVIAKRGPVVGHHYAHRRATCRPDHYAPLPSEPAYLAWGLSDPGQRALEKVGPPGGWQWFDVGTLHVHAQTRRALAAGNFIETWQQPNPSGYYREITGGCLAPRGLARLRLLSLPDWASFVTGEMARLKESLESPPYLSAEVQRLAETNLYFLEIDGGRMHKIGVTARPVGERVAEIQRDLNGSTIEVLRFIAGAGAVEPYFKWLFSEKVTHKTEYFAGLDIAGVLDELDQVAKVGVPERPKLVFERREFIGIFSHAAAYEKNEYSGYYEPDIYLVNIKDFITGKRVLDHYKWKLGTNWHVLYESGTSNRYIEPLAGNLIKFTATLENNRLLRPAKIENLYGSRGNR